MVINGEHELVGICESKIDGIVKKESSLNNNVQIKIVSNKLSENKLFVEVETSEINKNGFSKILMVFISLLSDKKNNINC